MPFWIALSKRRKYGVIVSSKLINKKIFRWFLDFLWRKFRREDCDTKTPCFIFDIYNAHWNDETVDKMKQASDEYQSLHIHLN